MATSLLATRPSSAGRRRLERFAFVWVWGSKCVLVVDGARDAVHRSFDRYVARSRRE